MKNCWKFYKFYNFIETVPWYPVHIGMFFSLCSFFLSILTVVLRVRGLAVDNEKMEVNNKKALDNLFMFQPNLNIETTD